MERETDLTDYLRQLGADRMPHSGRTLLEHLVGTAELVDSWGFPPPVVRAALFHSVYGTQSYRSAALELTDREKLRERIGEDAERLAFLFHSIDRMSLFSGEGIRGLRSRNGDDLRVTPSEFEAIAHIMLANNIEQNRGSDLLSRCRLVEVRRDSRRLETHLSASAIAELERIDANAPAPWLVAACVGALRRFVGRRYPSGSIDPSHLVAT